MTAFIHQLKQYALADNSQTVFIIGCMRTILAYRRIDRLTNLVGHRQSELLIAVITLTVSYIAIEDFHRVNKIM